ncbi:hypothetical protein HK099_005646 [Clydaea vesicula]|uniref:DUF2062 domain-containing protein n=1 Tax=Clydaea vesicula TaxID=447962 RepID=A0AAD5U6B7_9FUNG|nr:hypothetical protein HK099_005646 [Clydaea vesicula]KAJ3390957.1 hypothetical protein HDU92_000209 [Lobulomyces angularis]
MSKPSLRVKPTPLVRKTRIPTKRKVQGFIKRKIITPFISALKGIKDVYTFKFSNFKLKDGIKPHELSLVIVLGIIFGLWPILGTGTPLSLFISWYLKLNIPIMQALHVIFTPFAIALGN